MSATVGQRLGPLATKVISNCDFAHKIESQPGFRPGLNRPSDWPAGPFVS